jgi:diadenylate cyclase
MPEALTFPKLTWIAALDILIVAFVIYQVLVLIRGTRAVQMTIGLSVLAAFFYFSRWSRLDTVSWLLTSLLPYFVFAVIVIFLPEIRRTLAHFGNTPFFRGFSRMDRNQVYEEIVLAVTALAKSKTGALIVVERDIGLKSYIESGIEMNAVLSYDLLVAIFHKEVPLHDGAVIIQDARIAAAACFLPLTLKPRLSKELGTRHRAAIGITEDTDAVAIVVSEETGAIAFAHDGEIERFLTPETIRLRLRDAFERKALTPAPAVQPEPAPHLDS